MLWKEALAFCAWLGETTGRAIRLPTEAEWEKAARGPDGWIYPWGDRPPDHTLCNFDRNFFDTTPAGRYSPQGDSPYGCADMAGNVWEWCQTKYKPYPYRAADGREDLQPDGGLDGPRAYDRRVVRGGSFIYDRQEVRCAARYRSNPAHRDRHIGFRVVMVVADNSEA
jgi:formylglycine-generating enzyme required for sulfatase activity